MTSNSTRLFVAVAAVFLVLSVIGATYVLGRVPPGNPTNSPAGTTSSIADLEAEIAKADPSQGEALFSKYGCSACHGTQGGVGPYVVGLGARAGSRRQGYSAVAYLYESITDPNAFTVPGYSAGLMPKNFKDTIPEDQLYSLIAWLLKQ